MTATTSDEAALCASIRANPDEDTPRLVKSANRLCFMGFDAYNEASREGASTPVSALTKPHPRLRRGHVMATPQGTPTTLDNPDARLTQIREAFGVTCRIVVHPKYTEYAVAESGRVFSWSITTRHRAGELREVARTLNPKGYQYVRVQHNGRAWVIYVHRLLAECFLPVPKPEQTCVRHLDGDPANNALSNLAWGTHSENMKDMIRHGRSNRGEKNPSAKMTDRVVVAVRILVDEGYSFAAIGDLIGVDGQTISKAVSREQWGHVNE